MVGTTSPNDIKNTDDAAPAARWALAAWLGQQLIAAGKALVFVLGGGMVRAVVRKTLWVRAILAGLVTFAVLAFGLAVCVQAQVVPGPSAAPGGLFAAGLLVAVVTGAAVAWAAKGALGLYELQATWLALGALLWTLLSRPLLWPLGRPAAPWAPSLGEATFGPLWDRLLAVYLATGLCAAVFGASVALTLGLGSPSGALGRFRIALEGRLVRRSLARRGRSDLTATAKVATLGVALGVAALIVVTAVMSGYQADVEDRILKTNAHLVLQKYGTDFAEADSLLPQLTSLAGIEAAAPFAFNEAMLAVGQKSHAVLLKGTSSAGDRVTELSAQMCAHVCGQGPRATCLRQPKGPDGPPTVGPSASSSSAVHLAGPSSAATKLAAPILQPVSLPAELPWSPAAPAGTPGLVVGLTLFRALNVPVGATIEAITPLGLVGHAQRAPKRQRFVLRGVFQSGMHEFDSHLAYTTLPAAQALFGLGHNVSGIELRLRDPFAAGVQSAAILDALGHYPYRTLDWRTLNSSIFTAIALQKVVMFLLLSFIVVVASFNIASTLLMTVMQKSGQVAALKSMGAQDVTILRMFVLEGMAIGLMGCALGLLLGLASAWGIGKLELGLAADVYMVGRLTVAIDWREVLATVAVALAICQVATLLPALRAADLSPDRLFAEAD